jgi:hypothetical protein
MADWVAALVGVVIVGALFWVRAAFVSLNADMRAILAGQAKLRERVEALEEGDG